MLVQPAIRQYRSGFHDALRADLTASGIELTVVHGRPLGAEASKRDDLTLDWAEHVDAKVLRVGRKQLLWQPALQHIRGADLVVVGQVSALLLNYVTFARQMAGRERMAFWGHGLNFDTANRSRPGEAVKRFLSRRVHWWFAYNELAANVVVSLGFPAERITVVRNAIDTRSLLRQAESVTDDERATVRAAHGLRGRNVALSIGGMYDLKRLPYLIEAAKLIRRQVPDFELVFVGDGPDSDVVRAAAERHGWMHWVGAKFGREKLPYFGMAKLVLVPGRVGLVVVDAMVMGTPLVTVADSAHSPEIDYMEPGRNGVMLPAGTLPVGYAAEVVRLLVDDTDRECLAQAAVATGRCYTIEEMARRYAEGVRRALATPPPPFRGYRSNGRAATAARPQP